MVEIIEYPAFRRWLTGLKDKTARGVIVRRLMRLTAGNFGDAKAVGEGVSELRIHYGPGFRVYFARKDDKLVLLLGGGDKATQDTDIRNAIALLADINRNEA